MQTQCKICNKVFKSSNGLSHHITKTEKLSIQEYYDTYIDNSEHKCKICNNKASFTNINGGYLTYCSIKCAHLDPDVQAKTDATMIKRYGVKHMLQSDKVQHKIKQVCSTEEHKQLKKSVNLAKYGTEYYFQSKQCVDKLKEIRESKIKEFELQYDCIQEKDVNALFGGTGWKHLELPKLSLGRDKFIENKYLNQILQYKTYYDEHKYKACSIKEKDLVTFIKSFYAGKIIENSRKVIKPYELDIYLPDINIAVEFNGSYYHSTNNGTSKDYHYMKSKMCRNKKIRLIHIYEFEDMSIQKDLLRLLIEQNIDLYPSLDYNKNNLLNGFESIKPKMINKAYSIYGVGKLY